MKRVSSGALILCLFDRSLLSLIQVGVLLVEAVLDGQSGGSLDNASSESWQLALGTCEPACHYLLQKGPLQRKLGFSLALLGQRGLNRSQKLGLDGPSNMLRHHPSVAQPG